MIIDAHQHFWRLDRGDYGFPAPSDKVLHRDFLPADLQPMLTEAGVDATILVQATDTVAETAFLLELAARTPFVAGVVGWWDPREGVLLEQLGALPGSVALVGIRPMLQKSDDAGWLLESRAVEDLRRVADRGLAFDALVDARHLGVIRALCDAVPELAVVIDHMAKPWRQPALFAEWKADMAGLAGSPNCRVKVSGFPFSAEGAAAHSHLQDLVAQLRQWYGAERFVWGSDWPVVEREGGYARAIDTMTRCFSIDELPSVFRRAAERLYSLDGGRMERRRPA